MPGLDAAAYHERTKHSPRQLREGDFSLDFSNRPRPFKVYRDRPAVPLSARIRPTQQPALAAIAQADADPLAGTGSESPTMDLPTLSQLCYYSAGVIEGPDLPEESLDVHSRTREGHALDQLFIAASCTGKLYHIDLYLVAGDLPGLDAGVYHFDPPSYSLDRLRTGDYRGTLAEATGGHPGVANAPVSVVATSTWWRNAWKYRERTFRHAFWDSGTVLANLLAVAHGLDLRAEVVTGFADDAVADLIGVDPADEAPLEVVPLGGNSPVPSAEPVEPVGPETAPLSADPVDYPAIHDAWRAGVCADGDAVREWRESRVSDDIGTERADAIGSRPAGDGERFELDPVGDERAVKTPLPLAIRRRRSCRSYERTPLSFRKFSTILERATRGVPTDVRDPAGPPLQFVDPYLIVHAVEGLPAGAYRYHVADDELELLREGEFRGEAAHLALNQDWGGTPAVDVYLMADVDAVVDRLGDRGYRVAQLEAAVTGGRLYLATYAHRELGGTGLTFFDDPVTEFFGPMAEGQTPMFLYVFGTAAD